MRTLSLLLPRQHFIQRLFSISLCSCLLSIPQQIRLILILSLYQILVLSLTIISHRGIHSPSPLPIHNLNQAIIQISPNFDPIPILFLPSTVTRLLPSLFPPLTDLSFLILLIFLTLVRPILNLVPSTSRHNILFLQSLTSIRIRAHTPTARILRPIPKILTGLLQQLQ